MNDKCVGMEEASVRSRSCDGEAKSASVPLGTMPSLFVSVSFAKAR